MTRADSGFALFRQGPFRTVWSANLVFNLGLTMLNLGVAWTMTSLTDNPAPVSMIQTAASLPFVLFAIPLGIATDSVGHRRMMIVSQVWMLAVTLWLGVVALAEGWDLTPRWLLLAVFLIGLGNVVQQASWKPYLYELVPKDKVVEALSFNSLSSDIGRAAGPVLGGYLMGFFGTAVVLFTSTISHVYMLAVLMLTRRDSSAGTGDTDSSVTSSSFWRGWGLVLRTPDLYGPIMRSATVMITCGTLLGLLPLEAKENVQTGPIGYGGLLAALGIGSAVGAVLTPILRRHVPLGALSAGAVAVLGMATIGVSQWDSMALDAFFLLFFGSAWSVVSITHLSSVQMASPETMRGLLTAVYALAVQGSMALGSFAFGIAAQHIGVSRSILAAGLFALGSLSFVRRFPVREAV